MTKEDYVSVETAKLLKEKRFEGECQCFYEISPEDGITRVCGTDCHDNKKRMFEYSRPTLQMAMKWLREVHQIFIRPNTSFLYPIKWYSEIFCYGDNLKTQQDVKSEYYDSPEEACEAAIKYCLEKLI